MGRRPDRSHGEGSFAVHICGRAWECRVIAEMVDEQEAELNLLSGRPQGNQASRYHWAWSVSVFLDRLSLMWSLFNLFMSECGGDLARLEDALSSSTSSSSPQAADPFLDPPQDELIGVAYLHLDGLQYLLDVADVLPIFNFKGFRCGAVKVHVRCWIDTIETIPEYISVDKETKMSEFMDHKLIMRVYFESLLDLPEFICSGVYLAFRFFFHQGMYSTSRHCGIAVNPFLNEAIVIEQTISYDFLEYIKTGSLELEVYGKRVALSNLMEDSRPKDSSSGAVKALESGLGPVSFRLKEYLAPPVVSSHSSGAPPDKAIKYTVGDPFDWRRTKASDLDAALASAAVKSVHHLEEELKQMEEALEEANRKLHNASKVAAALKSDRDALQRELVKLRVLEPEYHSVKLRAEAAEQKLEESQKQVNHLKSSKKQSSVCVIS